MELRFQGFRLANSAQVLFDNWNLSIPLRAERASQNLGIMGPSGIGKTSLLRAILDETRGSSRSVELSPAVATSYVPQEPVLFRGLTIEANAAYFRFAGMYKVRFDQKLFDTLANRLGLTGLMSARRDPFTLSGGERQRVMLLRSLSIRPELLILDEPCSGMDLDVKQEFLYYLRRIIADLGVTVIYVSHHWDEVQLLCQQILYLTREGAADKPIEPLLLPASAFASAPPTIGAFHAVSGLHSTVWPVVRGEGKGDYQAEVVGDAGASEFVLACRLFPSGGKSAADGESQPGLLHTSASGPYRISVFNRSSPMDYPQLEDEWVGRGIVYRNQTIYDRVTVWLKRGESNLILCANSLS